jgi:dolichol-phosphate mannosyltransferase
VAFWDGCQLLKVRMYDGAAETWREWGRSLDLKDASSWGQTWSDVWLLWMLQGLPLPLLLGSLFVSLPATPLTAVLLGVNGLLVLIRVALGWAIASSYDRTQAQGAWLFWFSPLADPLAALRISLSALHTPTHWRGRVYNMNNDA